MLLLLVVVVISLLGFIKYIYSYWALKGFPNISPSIPSGNMGSFIKRKTSFGMAIYDLYTSTKEPFIGIYLFFRPAVLIRDAVLVKKVLIEDFRYFHDRGVHSNEKTTPMSGNLFSLPGEQWKTLRAKLTPAFTSGKLKTMFATFLEIGDSMQNYIKETVPKEGRIIELNDLSAKYSNDVILSAFFGLEANSFQDSENRFMKFRERLNRKSLLSTLAVATSFLCPMLFDLLQLHRLPNPGANFMTNLVKETIEQRDKNNVVRNDFMQLLLQLRNTGTVKEDGNLDAKATDGRKSLSIAQCAAQVSIFYIAGMSTSAATIAFCLYELGQNEDVMNKVLKDINRTLEKHSDELTYDSINDMKYLEICVKETLRKYPALPILNRECTQTYQIPGSNFTIDKGTAIIISLMGLHRDPEYFPDPTKFIPERFAKDDEHSYNEAAYIPFGDGPRSCIGFQQGKLSVKVALVKILTMFKIEAIEKKELEFDNYSVGLLPIGGVNVRFTRIEET